MPFDRCIGVLMGAGVGSTFIGLLMAFKITKYGLLLVTVAYCVMLFDKKPKGMIKENLYTYQDKRLNLDKDTETPFLSHSILISQIRGKTSQPEQTILLLNQVSFFKT